MLTCRACGTEPPRGSSFCNTCGAALIAQTPAPRFGSPDTYTPKHLAERILLSKSALEGERKQVTVLFADVKGSMELLADRDPEEARDILDPVLERMMEAVHRYEGTVNQVMGDGIMAVFGAPLALEDHAIRACYAALRTQESLARYNSQVLKLHGIPLQIRIGLNSGEVVVRAIRNDLHMDYTAVGRTTHLAARMEQIARPGSVLLTVHTLRLAESFVEVKPLGPVPVRGLPDPVEVYELSGALAPRMRFSTVAARGLTRFVGRQAELEALHSAAARARAGRGQVAALVGEPGTGKSRLVWEFTHSRATEGWLILETGSASYSRTTAYLPIIDLLRAYFQIEARDDTRKIRERVTGRVLSLDRALEPFLTAFLSLLNVTVEDPPWQQLDPTRRRQRTLEGIKRLLVAESRVQPVFLVFEDFQWADPETQAVLEALLDTLPGAGILLVVTYRPEHQPAWGSRTHVQLRIDPLPRENAEELLHALMGDEAALAPLKRLLIERTEGNPFFIEESVRDLVETAVLVGARGAYRLAGTVEGTQVPHTIRAVLAARIDRLPVEEKRLLQSAAVIGKNVPFVLLAAVAEQSDEALHRHLASLQSAELLRETTLFPDPEYVFKHNLTHEVAYVSLVHERRRTLHARLVDTIETVYADRLTEQIERLSYHAVRGEVWDKAADYLAKAGAKAVARSAFREGADCFEQALDALSRVPERRATMEQTVDLRLAAHRALHPLGATEQIDHHLREAETLAKRLGDERRLGRVAADMASYLWLTGKPVLAAESARRALGGAAGSDPSLTLAARYYLGLAYHGLGDYRQAIDVLQTNVSSSDGDLPHERFGVLFLAASCAWLAWCLAELGDFAAAADCGARGLRIAEATNQQSSLIAPNFGTGVVHLTRGDFPRSAMFLERSLELARTSEYLHYLPLFRAALACAYAQAGRLDAASALLEETGRQTITFAVGTNVFLSEAYLLTGRLEEARGLATHTLELTRESTHRGLEAYALRLLGEISAHPGAPDLAVAAARFREALGLAQQLGMRPLVAHCHLGLGRVRRRGAREREAREHLTSAATSYRELDMQPWLEKVGAEMKGLA